MKCLYLIPARGGSKGIPRKNIRLLGGKPLIGYTLECALEIADQEDIFVSTDDSEIAGVAETFGVQVPSLRPAHLATDQASTADVVQYTLEFLENTGKRYSHVVLLQPTSPFRRALHIRQAIALMDPSLEMVVSVKITDANPYYVLFEEDERGYLKKSKPGQFKTRQECPTVYEYNGSIYVIDASCIRQTSHLAFTKVVKYLMAPEYSLDIDSHLDWEFAEFLLEKAYVKI